MKPKKKKEYLENLTGYDWYLLRIYIVQFWLTWLSREFLQVVYIKLI